MFKKIFIIIFISAALGFYFIYGYYFPKEVKAPNDGFKGPNAPPFVIGPSGPPPK